MARITDLQIFSLDIQPDMTALAQRNISEVGLSDRVHAITADVCSMPFDNNSVDLVISRGSILFWQDRRTTCIEIHRTLKAGGIAYCGGGMGNSEIRAQVMENIKHNDAFKEDRELWLKKIGHGAACLEPEALVKTLQAAGLWATVERENDGIWI